MSEIVVTSGLAEAVERTINALAGSLAPGSEFSYAALEAASGVQRGSRKWSPFVAKFRDEVFRRTGVMLECVYNVGYRAPSGVEQLQRSFHRAGRAASRMSRERKVIGAIRDDALPDDEARGLRDFASRAFAKAESGLIDELVAVHRQLPPSVSTPRMGRLPAPVIS